MDNQANKFPDRKSFPTSSFRVEFDYFKTEEYDNLLVVPLKENFVIICGNQHLGTITRMPAAESFWEVSDGNLDGELLERIGAAIDNYVANET
jgi:hypothetical protein